jgi:hypothetical protein
MGAAFSICRALGKDSIMKISPISTIERALIIRQLAQHGKWEGTRFGAHIRLFRYKTAAGNKVQYVVGRGPLNVAGEAQNVGNAIRDINSLISGRPERRREPLVPVYVAAKVETWLPYKDA